MSKIEEPMLWSEVYELAKTDIALTHLLQVSKVNDEMTNEEVLLQMVIAQTRRIQEVEKALKSNFSDYLKPFQYKGAR